MYSFKKTLIKGAKYFAFFAIAALIDRFFLEFPDLANMPIGTLTVGTIITMLFNILKIKYGFSPKILGRKIF